MQRTENPLRMGVFDLINGWREDECRHNEAHPIAWEKSQKPVPKESARGSPQRAARDQKSAEHKKEHNSAGGKVQWVDAETSQKIAMIKDDERGQNKSTESEGIFSRIERTR
jgi:hypothetical protein